MRRLLLLAFGAALLLNSSSWAQDADTDFSSVPPPKPPYIARTAQRSAWTIEFTPSQGGGVTSSSTGTAAAPPGAAKVPGKQLKKQDWTKTGGLMRCVNTWTDGTTTEDWVVGSVLLSRDPTGKGIRADNPKGDPHFHDFGTSDFALLDWITAKDYDRVVRHADETCYLFSAKTLAAAVNTGPHNKTLAQINAPETPTSVFISIQSGLPVELDNGDGKYIYHYLPTPSDQLKLPDAYLTLLKALRGH
jgi:hypothetical protein